MVYLKFAGLSLVALIVALVTIITLSLWFALIPFFLVCGIIFLIEPAYLKWSLGLWVTLSFLALWNIDKWVPLFVTVPAGNDYGLEFAKMLYAFPAIILINPIAYLIGKFGYQMFERSAGYE